MKKKWTIIMPAVLCFALAAAGCGKKDDAPTFTGGGTEEPEYQENLNMISPSAYSNVQGLNLEPGTYISIIGKDENSAYWKEVKRGVDQAAKDLNEMLGYSGDDKIKVTFNAPDGENIDEQVNILDEELARYPDAIGIASIDEDACKVQFDSATENGIPIIALDSGNTYQGIQCTVKTENITAAGTAANQLCNQIEDQGEVLILAADSNSEAAKERVNGFIQEIRNNHPDVVIAETIYCDQFDQLKKEIADEKNAGNTNEESKAAAEEISDQDVMQYYLDKHPNLKGIFATNSSATQRVLEVLKEKDLTEEIALMGFDAGKDQLEALSEGGIDGLAVQNPFGIGYGSVVAASRTILQTGNEATVNTGYVWVTKDNLDEESIQKMLYE